MSKEVKGSKYLLDQEHITDKEINELYDQADNLKLRLERFKSYDKEYRELEEVNTIESEIKRSSLLNACTPILNEIVEILDEMEENSKDVKNLFLKAKGALEEKIELEK